MITPTVSLGTDAATAAVAPRAAVRGLTHLTALLLAVLVVGAGLVVFDRGAQQFAGDNLQRMVLANRGALHVRKDSSATLLREAFSRPDVLVLMGSSELNTVDYYRPGRFFASAPTGFMVFPLGHAGTDTLVMLEHIAAVASSVRGKKVAISVSAPWMFQRIVNPDQYHGNFYMENAAALVFSADFSMDLKRDAAQAMLDYPKTLEKNLPVQLGAQWLAAGDPLHLALYYLLFPLGQLQNVVFRLQDDWETMRWMRALRSPGHPEDAPSAPIDWSSEIAHGDRLARKRSDNNPYGIDNDAWRREYEKDTKLWHKQWTDKGFKEMVDQAQEWQNLDLLLRSLRELGAEPLVLNMPMPGKWWDGIGVTTDGRQYYYDKLQRLVAPYHVPLYQFQHYEYDNYFMHDPMAHLSEKGWAVYDQILDAFYHKRLP